MWVYVQSIVDTGIGQRVVYQTVKPTNSPDPSTTVPVGTGPYNASTHQILAQFDNQNPRIWPPVATALDLPTSGVLEGDQCWVIDTTAMYYANADGGSWAVGSGGGSLTLDQVVTGGTPNNTTTIPDSAPLSLSSGSGIMLDLDPSTDTSILSGSTVTVQTRSQDSAPTGNVTLRSGTSGTSSSGNVSISTGTAATSSGDVTIRTGNGPDGSGNIEITAGQTVTGTGGEVSIKAGNASDLTGSAGVVGIESGYNSAQGTYAPIFVVGGGLQVSTDTDVAGGVNFSNGMSLGTNSGLVPTAFVMTTDGNPNGNVLSNVGSIAIDTTTPGLYQNTDGLTAWTPIGSGPFFQFNGVDLSQFDLTPDTLGTPVNPQLSVADGALILSMDVGSSVGSQATWFVSPTTVPWSQIKGIRFVFTPTSGVSVTDDFRVGIVAGADRTLSTTMAFLVSSGNELNIAIGNGSVPGALITNIPITLSSVTTVQIDFFSNRLDASTFAPNGVPTYVGNVEVATLTPNGVTKNSIFSFSSLGFAGPDWGPAVPANIGVTLQCSSGVVDPVGVSVNIAAFTIY